MYLLSFLHIVLLSMCFKAGDVTNDYIRNLITRNTVVLFFEGSRYRKIQNGHRLWFRQYLFNIESCHTVKNK